MGHRSLSTETRVQPKHAFLPFSVQRSKDNGPHKESPRVPAAYASSPAKTEMRAQQALLEEALEQIKVCVSVRAFSHPHSLNTALLLHEFEVEAPGYTFMDLMQRAGDKWDAFKPVWVCLLMPTKQALGPHTLQVLQIGCLSGRHCLPFDSSTFRNFCLLRSLCSMRTSTCSGTSWTLESS